jgi:YfiH family protein
MSAFRWAGDHLAIDLPGAHVVFTTRRGGVSDGPYASLNLGLLTEDDPAAVTENRRRVTDGLGVALLQGRQVHGTTVMRAGRPHAVPPESDGQATAAAGVAPIVLTADCLPVAIAAPGAIAMVHAGWRGLAGGVLEAGVRALAAGGGPIHAAIGPGAGGCCYEVGADVAARFPGWALDGRLLDLKAVATSRLRDAGVAEVVDVGRCTMCEPDVFFSHRGSGGITGRQGGLIWRS